MPDFNTTDQTKSWSIVKKKITPPTIQGEFVYNGQSRSPSISNYDNSEITLSGTTSATNVGVYTITITLSDTDNTSWRNGTSTTLSSTWKIDKAKLTAPTVSGSYTYDGTEKQANIGQYDPNLINVTGDTAKTNAGTYTITLSIVDKTNYEWNEGGTTDKTVTWSIGKASVAIPTVSGDYQYNGSVKNAYISTYNSSIIVQSGTASATNGGTYTVYFDLINTNNYQWSDGSISQKSGTWSIGAAADLAVPTVSSSLTFNKQAQSPTLTGFDSNFMSVTGNSQTNAGDYTATISLTHPEARIWSDGTTASKSVAWSIDRKMIDIPTIGADKTYNGLEQDAPISGMNSDYVQVTSGSTIKGTNAGTYGGYFELIYKNDTAWGSSVKIVSWANGTDAEIAAMVQAANEGKIDLADYWNLGDERQVSLSAMSASSLGESHSAQTITFVLMHQGLYDLVTPVLDKNGNTRTKCSFVVGMKHCLATTGKMNSSDTNSGSWNGCARRTWCNSTFRNSIPSTLRSIFAQFKTITAQTYNGSTNQISNDYFALPAAKEIFGTRSYSNQTETDALTQFWYYTSGAAASNKKKIRGGNNAELPSGDGNWYWLRSPFSSNASFFCYVDENGSVDYDDAHYAGGLAPFGCIN